ncbi:MAG: YncE family protein [Muribaculaceae bacterium]|nr:YncE family protein [Muribaculaceae bacterium]
MNKFFFFAAAALTLCVASCDNNDDPKEPEICPPADTKELLYVVNAGNWNFSNASITGYDPELKLAYNNLFYEANEFKLGDTAQSASIHGAQCWIVVNNSNVIFGVDADNFKETGRIDKGLISPRYIHFVDNDKAYVSQMYSDSIVVVDYKHYRVTGRIGVPAQAESMSDGSTEEFVQVGSYVYCNQWNYGNRILKIDTKTDKVVGSISTGIQPYSIVKDKNGMIWCLCDGGGWADNPVGYEAPSLLCIDPEAMSVVKTFTMELGDVVSKLCVSGDGETLYWIMNRYDETGKNTGGVFSMAVDESSLPGVPTVASADKSFYSITISPAEENIYVADPLDYVQAGIVYVYSKDGVAIGSFKAGIIPTAYAWRIR